MVQHGSELLPPSTSCSSITHFYIFVTNNTKRELKTFCKVNKDFHHCQIVCKRILTCKHMLIQLRSTLYLSDEEGESWKDVRGEMCEADVRQMEPSYERHVPGGHWCTSVREYFWFIVIRLKLLKHNHSHIRHSPLVKLSEILKDLAWKRLTFFAGNS